MENIQKKSPEELIREAEAEILEPRHAFDMVIPGEIRWRTDISKDCQWLYALIRNLCRREGYCWATNEYLGTEMNVDPRTIQRYVIKLEKSGVIKREVVNFGMKNRRRIFLTSELKKVIITTAVSPRSRQDCREDGDRIVAEQKRSITEENNSCSVHPCLGASKRPGNFEKQTSSKEPLRVSESEVFSYVLKFHPDWTTEEVEKALEALWKCTGPVNSIPGYLEGTIKKMRNKVNFEKMEKAKCIQKTSLTTKQNLSSTEEKKSQTRSSEKYADQDTIRQLFPDL